MFIKVILESFSNKNKLTFEPVALKALCHLGRVVGIRFDLIRGLQEYPRCKCLPICTSTCIHYCLVHNFSIFPCNLVYNCSGLFLYDDLPDAHVLIFSNTKSYKYREIERNQPGFNVLIFPETNTNSTK